MYRLIPLLWMAGLWLSGCSFQLALGHQEATSAIIVGVGEAESRETATELALADARRKLDLFSPTHELYLIENPTEDRRLGVLPGLPTRTREFWIVRAKFIAKAPG